MSEVKKTSKAETVEAMRGIIANQKGSVLAEFRGLTVGEITGLRKKLREVQAEFKVVKNTMIRRAAKDSGFSQLEEFF
ncbi:MAG: 50S ribosomal protein L10, partial [Deltaproteobacteria bacterium]|nr:50S ribosomal protein L10 [Deltaproteobacteria bacterium]